MGTGPTRRKHGNSTSKKTMKRRGALQNRVKDVDQIQDELHRLKHGLPKALKAVVTYDEDLPGSVRRPLALMERRMWCFDRRDRGWARWTAAA